MAFWPISEAKNRFSELLDEAQIHGPQSITRHGEQRAVVLSLSDYRLLRASRPSLKGLLLNGPKADGFDGLELERDRDTGSKRALEF